MSTNQPRPRRASVAWTTLSSSAGQGEGVIEMRTPVVGVPEATVIVCLAGWKPVAVASTSQVPTGIAETVQEPSAIEVALEKSPFDTGKVLNSPWLTKIFAP